MIYYIHVLGDDISDFEKNGYVEYRLPEDTMWFAGKNGSTKDDADIASELLEIMPELFLEHNKNTTSTYYYNRLKSEIER